MSLAAPCTKVHRYPLREHKWMRQLASTYNLAAGFCQKSSCQLLAMQMSMLAGFGHTMQSQDLVRCREDVPGLRAHAALFPAPPSVPEGASHTHNAPACQRTNSHLAAGLVLRTSQNPFERLHLALCTARSIVACHSGFLYLAALAMNGRSTGLAAMDCMLSDVLLEAKMSMANASSAMQNTPV